MGHLRHDLPSSLLPPVVMSRPCSCLICVHVSTTTGLLIVCFSCACSCLASANVPLPGVQVKLNVSRFRLCSSLSSVTPHLSTHRIPSHPHPCLVNVSYYVSWLLIVQGIICSGSFLPNVLPLSALVDPKSLTLSISSSTHPSTSLMGVSAPPTIKPLHLSPCGRLT